VLFINLLEYLVDLLTPPAITSDWFETAFRFESGGMKQTTPTIAITPAIQPMLALYKFRNKKTLLQ